MTRGQLCCNGIPFSYRISIVAKQCNSCITLPWKRFQIAEEIMHNLFGDLEPLLPQAEKAGSTPVLLKTHGQARTLPCSLKCNDSEYSHVCYGVGSAEYSVHPGEFKIKTMWSRVSSKLFEDLWKRCWTHMDRTRMKYIGWTYEKLESHLLAALKSGMKHIESIRQLIFSSGTVIDDMLKLMRKRITKSFV